MDAEHKATELQICSFKQPHMRTFHASWMGFFSTFFSTFAPAPLAAYLKREDTLGLYCRSARANACGEGFTYWIHFVFELGCIAPFRTKPPALRYPAAFYTLARCLRLQDGDGHREREHRLSTTCRPLCTNRKSDVFSTVLEPSVGNDFGEDVFLFCEMRADTESGLSVHGFGSLVLQRWR